MWSMHREPKCAKTHTKGPLAFSQPEGLGAGQSHGSPPRGPHFLPILNASALHTGLFWLRSHLRCLKPWYFYNHD